MSTVGMGHGPWAGASGCLKEGPCGRRPSTAVARDEGNEGEGSSGAEEERARGGQRGREL